MPVSVSVYDLCLLSGTPTRLAETDLPTEMPFGRGRLAQGTTYYKVLHTGTSCRILCAAAIQSVAILLLYRLVYVSVLVFFLFVIL